MTPKIEWSDFEKVKILAGTILEVEEFPEARKPAFKLKIDFGELGILRSSAQITAHYSREKLIGRQVIAVVNFEEKQIGTFMSQCLVCGLADSEDKVVLVSPDLAVPNGAKLF